MDTTGSPVCVFCRLCTFLLTTVLSSFWLLEVMVDPKFDVEYLSAEDFYRKFKVFKENLNEKGPSLLLKAVENHPFQSTSLKVCNFERI